MKTKYYCKCGKEISRFSIKYGSGLCRSCSCKERLKIPENHPNFKHGNYVDNKYCINCGEKISCHAERCQSCATKEFLKTPADNPMFGVHRFGKKAPLYKNGKTLIKSYCLDCEKKLNKLAFYLGNERCQSCAAKKRFNIPENNTNWQGGISFEPYSLEWTEDLRESIRSRDNYECQLCNFTNKEHLIIWDKSLEVHHIDYNKKNCNKDNLISLCIQCHMKTNYNRNYWQNYYILKLGGLRIYSKPPTSLGSSIGRATDL